MKRTAIGRVAAILSALLILTPQLWAAGGGEESSHEEHEAAEHHDEHEEGLPDIEPIELSDGGRLVVVASTNLLGDVLANVAGDAADVTVLMELGQNPHSYEPTPSALRIIERAHVIFTNGLELEENLLDDLDSLAGGYVVEASAGIEPLEPAEHHEEEHDDHDDDQGHDHGTGDPHVWMDPNNAIVWVENIIHVLSAADPANADLYQSNGQEYIHELEEIDEWIREEVALIAMERRKLVVDHELFTYFADEYGFETVGAVVPATTDTAEPSARDIARLVETIKAEGVDAIFVSRTASRALAKLANTVAEEVGRDVAIIPTLTGSLAPAGEPGDTYLGFLRYNMGQIMTGLAQ